MTDEQIVNDVTVCGTLSARPIFAETGGPRATFTIELGTNRVQCVAEGRIAENLLRFGAGGVEVVGQGQLIWQGGVGPPYVLVERIGFTNPREVGMKMAWFDGRGFRRENVE